ncbi:MAG: LuxR C-terminal-related transcriptional regulator [Ruegeria sp.]
MADILLLSPHTVDTLVRRIFSKLDVADRTTAAIRGVGAGLILP